MFFSISLLTSHLRGKPDTIKNPIPQHRIGISSELRNFVIPDLLSKHLLDLLLRHLLRSNSNVGLMIVLARAIFAAALERGEYGSSTIVMAETYLWEWDYIVCASGNHLRTRDGQLYVCRHDLLTALAGVVEIYQTRWRAKPALDIASSEVEGIRGHEKLWTSPHPENPSSSFPSKYSKVIKRRLVTAYQVCNSFIEPCGDLVRSRKLDFLHGR